MTPKARTSKRISRPKEIRCAVIGYGGAFNMGKAHSEWINAASGLRAVAACDLDPKRRAAARQDFPEFRTYARVGNLLKDPEVDLCVVITPHNTHARLAVQCAQAGKHVVVEKPMCLSAAEATQMIQAARKAGVTLTVFHNRRHDGDYKAIKKAIDDGRIGQAFHVEMWGGSYGRPGTWWRSSKRVSGGHFYDWGAHYVDWLLNVMAPRQVVGVAGRFHKLVWHHVTNEDHVEAWIRFDDGAVADVQFSSIACADKPRWRILGTQGAIVDRWGGQFELTSVVKGVPMRAEVRYQESDWPAYYQNLANHLLRGQELEVKPEEAARVISIMEAAERSSRSGKVEKVAYP